MHVKLNFVFVHFIGGRLRLVVGGARDVADPKSDPGKLDGNVDPFMLLCLIKVVLLEAGQHCLP